MDHSPGSDTDSTAQAATDRRALLRHGGVAVVAGVAGLAVAETVMASPASAAPGGNVVLGAINDAGTTTTTVKSASTPGATLSLNNTAGVAPLSLVEQPTPPPPPSPQPPLASGDLVNYGGDLYYTHGDPSGPLVGFVYTAITANQLVTITPQRVLDTRTSAGRANIVSGAGNVNASGQLLGGRSITVSVGSLVVAPDAVYCNMAAIFPVGTGYLVLWPGGTRPGTSSLNYTAKSVVANFAVTGVTSTSTDDTVTIFASVTTSVLLDVTAFSVGNPGQVDPSLTSGAAAATPGQRIAARAKNGTLPGWYRPR
jgi:hypothetical protein